LPELKGKFHGIAIRVPTPNVSLVDLTFQSTRALDVEAINGAFKEAAAGPMKGILACTEEPLVSVDFNGCTFSSVADLTNTMVMGDKMAKVFSWYDNETGFSNRMIDVTRYIAEQGL